MQAKLIKTETEYDLALSRIDELMGALPDTSDGDELELLVTLVELYEEKKYPIDLPDAVSAIRFRMEQQGLRQKDLVPFIGSKSKVSEVLSGQRPLSLSMMRRLHAGLGIPVEVLLQEPAVRLPERDTCRHGMKRSPSCSHGTSGIISPSSANEMLVKINNSMQPLRMMAPGTFSEIRYILTDIDDTLTLTGKLPASAYSALWRLAAAGYQVVPVTGRPAGWCDLIARQWPVAGVVGENGALYFRYDEQRRVMVRRYWKTAEERSIDQRRLAVIREEVLRRVPGCAVAADQAYREADLAIDFCEDVAPLEKKAVEAIVDCFIRAGAIAKISSIHVNGWYGDYDKLAMSRRFFSDIFAIDMEINRHQILYAGDSPNDAPMFGFFPHSVGVANILNFSEQLEHQPAWVTNKEGGDGFAELADLLLTVHPTSPARQDP